MTKSIENNIVETTVLFNDFELMLLQKLIKSVEIAELSNLVAY